MNEELKLIATAFLPQHPLDVQNTISPHASVHRNRVKYRFGWMWFAKPDKSIDCNANQFTLKKHSVCCKTTEIRCEFFASNFFIFYDLTPQLNDFGRDPAAFTWPNSDHVARPRSDHVAQQTWRYPSAITWPSSDHVTQPSSHHVPSCDHVTQPSSDHVAQQPSRDPAAITGDVGLYAMVHWCENLRIWRP